MKQKIILISFVALIIINVGLLSGCNEMETTEKQYEENYTTLTNISFKSDKNASQGIAVNDTFYWTTGGSDNFHIYKYRVSDDTEVLNRDVEGDLPADVNQVNGLYLDEANDLLYTGANDYAADVASQGWMTIFNATDLTFISIHALSQGTMCEGGSFHNGSWWIVDDFLRNVYNYDISWDHIATYALSYPITGSIHDGYNGITWYGDDIFCGTHDGTDQEHVIDRYHWNGNGFDEVRRYLSSEGDLPNHCDQGVYYYDGYFYSCMRDHIPPLDGICKMELTGWNEIQQNNTVNNGIYTCDFDNATINNHTYYWKVSVTDGTDTNDEWYNFTVNQQILLFHNIFIQ